MRLSSWQFVLARLIFLIYVLFTSAYCLLAYIPFTYQQVHIGALLPWLTDLVGLHSLLYWPVWFAVLLTIIPDLKVGPSRYVSRGFAVAGLLAGIVLLLHPLLPHLSNDVVSLRWSLFSLVPLLWLSAIDWLHERDMILWPGLANDGTSKVFLACLSAAFYNTVVFFLLGIFRGRPSLQLHESQWLSLLIWSLISHLLIFFLLFVVIDLVSVLASLLSGKSAQSKAAFLGALLLQIVIVTSILRSVILPALSLHGLPALAVSIMLGFSLNVYASSTSIRLWNPRGSSNTQILDLFLLPFTFHRRSSRIKQGLLLLVLACFAWIVSLRFSHLDWDFLFEQIITLVVWVVALAIFYIIIPPNKRVARVCAYATGVLLLTAYLGFIAVQPRWSSEENSPTPIGNAIDSMEGYDLSFRLADTFLHGHWGPRSSGGFYSFLADNTNLPRSIHVSPIDINLVSRLTAMPGRKPNIFIFVIDSLRRDYVSPYNSAVTFTPALDSLARDSIVFQNAFTRYGGTGFSEPSIWVGGMMLHQQYISPFSPLNSLQKLLDINRYAEWISKDNILQQILPPSPNINELDSNVGAMHYDLCRTLEELGQRLQSSSPTSPIFVYTQPQNIHVSIIDREARSVPDGVQFPPAFNAAYAWRIQRLDTCFGEFLATLRKTGLYDDSIIIVTSDHGDSLGEHGRWGHAYTLFPEIVRIPLIVHLPAQLQNSLKYDPKAVAFLTDITPSLYYLLGQQSVLNDPLFGRPLFTATADEQRPYLRNTYLLASSYAPVYGLLSNSGHSLYIADGVNYRDYAFQLNSDGSNTEAPLTDREKTDNQQRIREQVQAIADFYHLH